MLAIRQRHDLTRVPVAEELVLSALRGRIRIYYQGAARIVRSILADVATATTVLGIVLRPAILF